MRPSDINAPKVVWEPLPGSQTLAMSCPAQIILYHGSRGPGKTDAQLMRFRRHVGQGFGKYWRGIIYDREYKNLDDLVSKSQRWYPEFKDGAKFLSSKSDYRWVWPTGEELMFRALKKDSDYWSYHGQEFPFIGVNEATKFPSSDLFDLMMSCNRSSFLPDYDDPNNPGEIPLLAFLTANPSGPGHNHIKRRFINQSPPGAILKRYVNVFNPRTQKREDVLKTQTHIFGSYRENKYLAPEYIAELEGITDPNKRKAWLGGSWDVVSGGMFDDVWTTDVHVIEPFEIPPNWKIDRSFDWGSAKPFSTGWWAESAGGDVITADGKLMRTVKGDLFRIGEWYGCDPDKPNKGLNMLASEVAAGIIEREMSMGIHNRVKPGPADNSIWNVDDGNSIAVNMLKPVYIDGVGHRGVAWIRSDKSRGSRKAGWAKMKQMLKDALPNLSGRRTQPGLFVFNSCKDFIATFPILPRDDKDVDDVNSSAEDHIADEARYRVLNSYSIVRSGKTVGLGG